MLSFILMKAFETAPMRYDCGLNLISFGNINKVKMDIVNGFIKPGNIVLDIGCGTGSHKR